VQAAQLTHLSHRLLVDVADTVPEEVAARRLNEQSALADPEARPRVDAPQRLLSLDLAQAVLVAACLHLVERRPLLPSPADVLTLVVADQAPFGGRRALSVLHSAGLTDVRHTSGHRRNLTSAPGFGQQKAALHLAKAAFFWLPG